MSVIIPTIGRPHLIARAVNSVLAQTYRNIELIVALEGPNAATLQVLETIDDPRLQIRHHPVPLGAGPARNAAAAAASGSWLAFLDDDDEWLPEKLERQLAAASVDDTVLVSCRCRVVTGRGTYVWPRRLYRESETIDDYLFDRKSFTRGEAYLTPTSMLLPAHVFRRSGFAEASLHEDTTLLLRVTKQLGGHIVMVPEVLAVTYTELGVASLGTVFSWRHALEWLDENAPLMTRRAYSGFCLVTIVSQAVRARDYAAFRILLERAWRFGAPTPIQRALFLAFWSGPTELRRRARALLTASRHAPVKELGP